jgi:dihydrophenazinedicarboxylate synthase
VTIAGSRWESLGGEILLELPEFDDPPGDPIALLRKWIEGARDRVREPMALALATVDRDYDPSCRVVLAKEVDERGLVFTTHHGSRKGRDIDAVGRAAGTLYWRETLQQVNVAGPVERLTDDRSDQLFQERPVAAQATTTVSRQGQPLPDPRALRERAEGLATRGEPLLRPEGWGGYRLVPDRIEFWHGSTDRLHRRLCYARDGDSWSHRRLQP